MSRVPNDGSSPDLRGSDLAVERMREAVGNGRGTKRRPPKYSERSMEAYWRGREDEARIREELDGAPVDFEPTEKALEFPPPAEHDFASCRTPGHRSCAARRAWVTMRSKGIKPGGAT